MSDELRSLLTDVAEGRMDPSDAARRLDRIDAPETREPSGEDPWAAATDHDDAPSDAAAGAASTDDAARTGGVRDDGPVTTVRIQASARPVRVVGDPTVATITVDGPHAVRRDGGTLRVEAPVA